MIVYAKYWLGRVLPNGEKKTVIIDKGKSIFIQVKILLGIVLDILISL